MTKIEEELASIREVKNGYVCEMSYYEDWDIVSVIKSYAEFYAKKCLKIAANQADIHPMRAYNVVNKKSITEIKLPEHD